MGDSRLGCPGELARQGLERPLLCLKPSQIAPVARGYVLAYSCAAARDLHPLPCPPQARRTREPIFESLKNVLARCQRRQTLFLFTTGAQGRDETLGNQVSR